jgi:hypothetical protein
LRTTWPCSSNGRRNTAWPITTAARSATDEGTQPPRLFDTIALERQGWSIQYVDPVGLAEKDALGDGVLSADGPQYRALVIDERAIPAAAAEALVKAAASGVRIVLVGELPSQDTTFGSGTGGDQKVRAAIKQLLRSRNVARVETQADVLGALTRMSLAPRVSSADTHVFTQLRYSDGTRYVFLYNPTNDAVTFTPAIEGTGALYELDTWSGQRKNVAQYATLQPQQRPPSHRHRERSAEPSGKPRPIHMGARRGSGDPDRAEDHHHPGPVRNLPALGLARPRPDRR